MKLKQILEYSGFIKRKKPSTEKVNIPLSAYGNQPLTTFNKSDQDSAMSYWKDILKLFNKKTKLSESKGLPRSKDEIIEIIKSHIDYLFTNFELEGLDFDIEKIEVYGSRTTGKDREDSDLDVKLYYSGDAREDDLFNALHREETELDIDGITVDINPVKID